MMCRSCRRLVLTCRRFVSLNIVKESCRFKLLGLRHSTSVVFGIDCSKCLKEAIVSKPMVVDGLRPREE